MNDENVNEYDDEAFSTAADELDQAIHALWEAGASAEDIRAEVANALKNAIGE